MTPSQNATPIDNALRQKTPEGIVLQWTPAGPTPRFFAFLVDFALRVVALGVLALALFPAFGYDGGAGLLAIAFFALLWLYPVFFEALNDGQTPGKRIFGLQTRRDNGTPIDWQTSLTRNALLAADFLPVAFFAGAVSVLASGKFKRIGDHVAGTVVVYVDRQKPKPPLQTQGSRLPPLPLTLQEQTALLAWAERQSALSADRFDELAALIAPQAGLSRRQKTQRALEYVGAIVGDGDCAFSDPAPIKKPRTPWQKTP